MKRVLLLLSLLPLAAMAQTPAPATPAPMTMARRSGTTALTDSPRRA